MTRTIRSAASLVVAPTQNTAPVHEFRCLYTHDLRKKKKTWHDGSLRFHTFNRRVMVYDDSKNYIGDLHYREAEELQEGEELKLDKGVLVDVGERVGRTETDLAPLLERRRPDEQASTEQTHPHPPSGQFPKPSRTLPAYSSGQPKSLAALLGTSQGPIGRARFPSKSPFEQRYDMSNAPLANPSSKRQRLSYGKENLILNEEHIHESQQGHKTEGFSSSKAAHVTPLAEKRQPMAPKAVVEISSDEEVSSPFLSSRLAPIHSNMHRTRPQRVVESPQDSGLPCPSLKQRRKQSSVREAKSASPKYTDNAIDYENSVPTRLYRTGGVATSSLRFANEKPREKLMYKQLLPSSMVSPGEEETARVPHKNAKNSKARGHTTNNWASKGICIPESGALCDIYNLDGINPPLNLISNDGNALPNAAVADSVEMSQNSDSIFIRQSQDEKIDEDLIDQSQDNFAISLPPESAEPGVVTCLELASPMHKMQEESVEITSIFTKDELPVSTLTMLDQRLLKPLSNLCHQPDRTPEKSKCPLRRVLSESDSPVLISTNPAPATGPVVSPAAKAIPPPAQRSAFNNIKPKDGNTSTLSRFKNPTKLQRAMSDMTGLATGQKAAPKAVNVQPIQEPMDIDVGPWSSKEAFLLFDFWPPDREDKRPKIIGSEDKVLTRPMLHDDDDI